MQVPFLQPFPVLVRLLRQMYECSDVASEASTAADGDSSASAEKTHSVMVYGCVKVSTGAPRRLVLEWLTAPMADMVSLPTLGPIHPHYHQATLTPNGGALFVVV